VSAINKDGLLINEEIREKELRLIDENGSVLGIMSAREAQLIANEHETDLVLIAPNAVPPVCKLMDYKKYVFDQAKKDRDAKKNQKVVSVKEVRLSIGIGEHDFNVKLKNAIKFLEEGNKVKVAVFFGGRELRYTNEGEVLVDKMAECLKDYGTLEKRPKMEGRKVMSAIINPK
jgi:translation initiation factor IF-3